jgi:hypothetical protein
MRQWEKEEAICYSVKALPSWQTAFMLPQWQGNSVLNLREINRNNTHTALASVLMSFLNFVVSSL